MTEETAAHVRTEAILAAALGVFAAYGFRRSAMADIAEAAGLSRPALYRYFNNKAEIFRAASEAMQEKALAAMAVSAAAEAPLPDRLAEMLIAWKLPSWRVLRETPHGRELADLNSALAEDVTHAAIARGVATLARTLGDEAASGRDAAEDARLLAAAAWAAAERAEAEADFRADMHALARIFTAAIRSEPD